MKKLISIILAAVLIFTFSSTAFAAGNAITAGATKEITVEKGKTQSILFTADENAIYSVQISLKNEGIISAEIINNETENNVNYGLYASLDDEAYSNIFEEKDLYFCAEKGKAFTIALECYSDFFENMPGINADLDSVKVELTVKKADVRKISLNGTYTVSEDYEVFLFVPEKDGYYNFCSNASGNSNPAVAINGLDGVIVENDDNGYYNDYNFDLTSYLEEGRVYGVEISNYSLYDNDTEPFTFTVSKGDDIKVDYLEVSDRVIYVAENNDNGFSVYGIPTGAADANIVVTSADESIATAEVDFSIANMTDIIVLGVSAGKTTVTVTETKSGVSTDVTVIVLPEIVFDIISAIQIAFWTVVNAISNVIDYVISWIF